MTAPADALAAILSSTLTDAAPKARSLVDAALKDAQEIGGEAGSKAGACAVALTFVLKEAAAGRIDADAASEAASRCFAGLDAVKDGAIEAGQRQAAARAREGLALAKDVGLALLRAGLTVAAGAL